MKKLITVCLVLISQYSFAGFHYCEGLVTSLVTRSSGEETQVYIEGMTGPARLNYGGAEFVEMHDRQFSMLLAAYMAGKTVRLEFVDENGLTECSQNHSGVPIRYVLLN